MSGYWRRSIEAVSSPGKDDNVILSLSIFSQTSAVAISSVADEFGIFISNKTLVNNASGTLSALNIPTLHPSSDEY